MIGGGGPVPSHSASPDPYAMSPDTSSDDGEDDLPKTAGSATGDDDDNSFGVTPSMAHAAREMEEFFSHI